MTRESFEIVEITHRCVQQLATRKAEGNPMDRKSNNRSSGRIIVDIECYGAATRQKGRGQLPDFSQNGVLVSETGLTPARGELVGITVDSANGPILFVGWVVRHIDHGFANRVRSSERRIDRIRGKFHGNRSDARPGSSRQVLKRCSFDDQRRACADLPGHLVARGRVGRSIARLCICGSSLDLGEVDAEMTTLAPAVGAMLDDASGEKGPFARKRDDEVDLPAEVASN